MNVKQFKEWLEQFDEDTVVQVCVMGEDVISTEVEFKAIEYYDYELVSFVGNRYVEPTSPHYNKQYLTLGVSDW